MNKHIDVNQNQSGSRQSDVLSRTGAAPTTTPSERRLFLRQMGILVTASTATFLASCAPDALVDPQSNRSGARTGVEYLPDGTIDLGSGDIGIANLAYTLDQLETAFYKTAFERAAVSATDRLVLAELHDHELAQREFFKALLGGLGIPMLDFDFSGVDFNNRNAVFDAAQQFENVGVGAFNGTGPLIQDVEVLKIAGKMVSIEARHATLARHMIAPKTKFTLSHELIDAQGLDWALTPAEVLARSQKYIKQKLSVANLPTL